LNPPELRAAQRTVRLIDPPGPIGAAQIAANSLIQNRRIALDPTPDRDVVNGEVPLGHDLLQIAVRQGVSQVPADAQEDDHVFEMSPSEQRWPFLSHDKRYQISSSRLQQNPVLGVTLLLEARTCLRVGGVLATWLVGLAALVTGAFLLVGFLTPIAGAVAGLGGAVVTLSRWAASIPVIFDSRLAVVFAVTMLVGIIVLGPGAFSLDARIFGWCEIIIPPPVLPSGT
jgi:hypothetical protein